MPTWVSTIAVPSVLLIAGLVDDLRSQKVHNKLVIGLVVFALIAVLSLGGWPALKEGLLGAGLALGLTFPLFTIRVIGAGDVKLMFAFGLTTSIATVFNVLLYSLVWGALLGLFQALFSGELKNLVMNTFQGFVLKPNEMTNLHKIPFTVALMFGWLSHLSTTFWGVRLW